MKSSDALLAAWQRTLGRAKDSPAILNTHGEVVRKFSEIDERARDFERKIETFKAGSVIAIQIGNHEDWASILIACLRRRLVVLPLEQSISDQQRDAALEICARKGCGVRCPQRKLPNAISAEDSRRYSKLGRALSITS